MSRVGESPVEIPEAVEVSISEEGAVRVKGPLGELFLLLHRYVRILPQEAGVVRFELNDQEKPPSSAMLGTYRALFANMVVGVSVGFTETLQLVGTGFRASVQGNVLNLSLGFSHPVVYSVPDGIKIETPSPTEIVIKGIDKQRVGAVAQTIYGFRKPDAYDGKGVRYLGKEITLKEVKKK